MNAASIPLEDELGDVLEKALRQLGLTACTAAERAGIPAEKVSEAMDYRDVLSDAELGRIARALQLNEVGLCALARGRYPRPAIAELPYRVHPLRMAHGIGVTNAYVISASESDSGLLFDLGPSPCALAEAWPFEIRSIAAIFLTHVEAEHTGGFPEIARRGHHPPILVPRGQTWPGGIPFGEGETRDVAEFRITAYSTPGHCAAHNCYLVEFAGTPRAPAVLISGDLIFAGSAGGAYFCRHQLGQHLRRMLESVPPETVIAPGHGPLTTAACELRFNPFLG